MYYFLIFFLLCIGCYISLSIDGHRYEKPFYIILFVLFWLTAGLRFETGMDYFSYQTTYEQTFTLSQAAKYGRMGDFNMEPGYVFLSSIFKSMGAEINMMFLFISLITSLLLFTSFHRYINKYKFFALLVYFSFVYFILDMSGVRQAIAVNIFLYSIRFIYEKKLFKFLILIIAACFFHSSAMIGIIAYWIFNKKISSAFIITSTLFGLIIIALKIPLMHLAVEDILSLFMPDVIINKLVYYSDVDIVWALNIKVILNIIVLFVLLYNRENLSAKFPYFNIIINSLFCYVFFREILWESADINSRINFYFIFGLVMGIPLLLDLVNKKDNILGVFVFITFLCFYQCNSFFFLRSIWNPYQNYLIFQIFDLKGSGKERFLEEANKL